MLVKQPNGDVSWGNGKSHRISAEILDAMRSQRRDSPKNKTLLKIFTPDAGATWELSEIDSETKDDIIFFGMCDLGLGFPELGYVSLSEIASLKGALGLSPERDLYYSPKLLSQL